MTEVVERVRHTDKLVQRIVELWPLWLTCAGGIVATINFYNTVKGLDNNQRSWQAAAEVRRDKDREEKESMRTRITSLEKDVEWLKKGR